MAPANDPFNVISGLSMSALFSATVERTPADKWNDKFAPFKVTHFEKVFPGCRRDTNRMLTLNKSR